MNGVDTPFSNIYKFFKREECLMGRDKEYPLTNELENNLTKLLEAINVIRAMYNKPMIISSCYRPGIYNTRAGGAPHSNHCICKAVDFHDPDGAIDNWLTNKQSLLKELGCWQEQPQKTRNWAHVDIAVREEKVRPNCGIRQFNP